jgi:hypothetical protein
MRNVRAVLVLTLGLVLPCACGGGGGGGDGDGAFSLADIVGEWQGPTATLTVAGDIGLAAGTTGLSIDASGDAVGTGASIREGTVSLQSATQGVYKFVGTGVTAGQVALLVLSADRDHLLWVTESLGLGAWERNASGFAGPYADSDIRDETWSGLAVTASPAMDLVTSDPVTATIDGAGNFSFGNVVTDVAPLVVTDTIKGAFGGDFVQTASSADTGNVVLLITPDRQFVAAFLCRDGGAYPNDCAFGALSR